MKPKIICHIMSSVDGRLLNGRWTLPYDGKSPSEIGGIYAEIGKTLKTQAWLFGRNILLIWGWTTVICNYYPLNRNS